MAVAKSQAELKRDISEANRAKTTTRTLGQNPNDERLQMPEDQPKRGDQSKRQAEQEKEYNFKLEDIVPENKRRVEVLMKTDPRSPEEEQEFLTLTGNVNQIVKQNRQNKDFEPKYDMAGNRIE